MSFLRELTITQMSLLVAAIFVVLIAAILLFNEARRPPDMATAPTVTPRPIIEGNFELVVPTPTLTFTPAPTTAP